MSASKNKKGKDTKEPGQLSNRFYTVISIIIAAALVFSIGFAIFQNVINATNFTAVEIGSEKVYKHEVNFYYMNAYMNFVNTYGDYAQYFGLDTSVSLKKQSYGEGTTWHDYFLDSAISSLRDAKMHVLEAGKAGVTLNDEYAERVESDFNSLSAELEASNYDIETYLKSYYGKSMTVEEYKRILSQTYLAQQYSSQVYNSFEFTDDQIKDHYAENKSDFDMVDYRSFTFSASPQTGTSATDDEIAAAKSAAKSLAEIMAGTVTDEESFIKLALQNASEEDKENYEDPNKTLTEDATYSRVGSSNPNLADWLFDSARTGGDVTVIETDSAYYVAYMIGRHRNDYNTVNVRHVLVSFDMDEGAEEATEAQKTAARKQTDLIEKEWQDGPHTEESFAELAAAHSADPGSASNGGLYEGVYKNQMVASFNDWIFDSSRKHGDVEVVETEYGYHLMYYVSEGRPYWTVQVEQAMRSAEYSEYTQDLLESTYPVKRHKMGLLSVGLPSR